MLIRNMFNGFSKIEDPNCFTVRTEQELVDKVSDCIKNLSPEQKMKFTFESPSDSRWSQSIYFGSQKKDFDKMPDLEVKILFQSKQPLWARLNPFSKTIYSMDLHKENGVGRGYFSDSSAPMSSSFQASSWNEEMDKCASEGSFGVWMSTVEKFQSSSPNRFLSSSTSEKISEIIKTKLQEIAPASKSLLTDLKNTIDFIINYKFSSIENL